MTSVLVIHRTTASGEKDVLIHICSVLIYVPQFLLMCQGIHGLDFKTIIDRLQWLSHPRQRRLGLSLSSSKPNKSQIRRSMGLSSSVLQRSIFVIVKVEVPQFQQLLTAERASLFGGGVSATAPASSKDFLAGLQFTTSN